MGDTGSDRAGDSGTTSHGGVLDAVGYAGSAVAAFAIGIAAVGLSLSVPPYGGIVGIVAIVVGLRSRKRLKNEPTLRGARLSLAGFLFGLAATLIGLAPILISTLMTASFLLLRV